MNKKYMLIVILIVMLLTTGIPLNIYHADNQPVNIYIDNVKVGFPDALPFISEGRTLVPIRPIAESMGIEISWNSNLEIVTVSDMENTESTIHLLINKNYSIVNGIAIDIDVPAKLKDERTYLPLRFIAESLNLNVEWDPQTNTVNIVSDEESNIKNQNTFTVNTIEEYVLHDNTRSREIPLRIYYPDGEGDFPVIIISHGLGGSKDALAYIGSYWAAHGYICIHPTHIGSDVSMFENDSNFSDNLLPIILDGSSLINGPRDVSYIIDNLDAIKKQIPNSSVKINKDMIGVAGHSLGAYTTVALAGGKVTLINKESVYLTDNRIKAFIALSPLGDSGLGIMFTPDSWYNINAPVMVMTGTKDDQLEIKKDYKWRVDTYTKMPEGDKYLIVIDDATHFTFTGDLNIDNSINEDHIRYIKTSSLNYWNAYLLKKDYANQLLRNHNVMEMLFDNNVKYNNK